MTVIIHNPGTSNYSIPPVYPPIALLNCLGKILEKLMANQLVYIAEKYNLLPLRSIGRQRQHSTIAAALALT
jgi:hypothetical protein